MSKIKECFVSRFNDGYIVEADYSQLEVIALAYLSGDRQLKHDLITGVDMHSANAKALFGAGFTPEQRKLAKRLSFQLQYGAGYKSMAKSNDIEETIAKEFISVYYSRYPEVKVWQNETWDTVGRARMPSPAKKTPKGYPAGISVIGSCTGRKYGFIEGDAWGETGNTSFKPTQVKNYPVQGLATGDIVPMMLGRLYRVLKNHSVLHDRALLINTVHDSVVLDVHPMYLDTTAELLKEVLESAPKVFEEIFSQRFDMPLPVEVSYGKNWNELTEYKF